jgi:deoxynucleoside triphosphate triphosphohydrolase SAMHD1
MLDENGRALFRKSRLAFVYASGWKEGRRELVRALQQYNVTAEVHIDVSDEALPSIHDVGIFLSEEDQTAFVSKCREIGRSLLFRPGDSKHDETWAEDRALGHGNKGLLIAFPYNTPAQTLTCLWLNGKYNNLPWQALLPRRKKR